MMTSRKHPDDEESPSKRRRLLATSQSVPPLPQASHFAGPTPPFPRQHAYRALALYSTLRTLSIPLRLSPMHPYAFLQQLQLPVVGILGNLHVTLLRILLRARLHYTHRKTALASLQRTRKRKSDGQRIVLKATDRLNELNAVTWPLYWDDYVVQTQGSVETEVALDWTLLLYETPTSTLSLSKKTRLTELCLYDDDPDEPPQHPSEDEWSEGGGEREEEIAEQEVIQQTPIVSKQKRATPLILPRQDTPEDTSQDVMDSAQDEIDPGEDQEEAHPMENDEDEEEHEWDGEVVDALDASTLLTDKRARVPTDRFQPPDETIKDTISTSNSPANPPKDPPVDPPTAAPPHDALSDPPADPPAPQQVDVALYLRNALAELQSTATAKDPPGKLASVETLEPSLAALDDFMWRGTKNASLTSVAPIVASGSAENLPSKPVSTDSEEPHFRALRQLRQGVPYHLLSLERKMEIFEYLVDELLQLDWVRHEFTQRQQRSPETLFSPLPTTQDYQDMENEDNCMICGKEGDLLCCDGCPRSIHRECAGVGPHQDLADGDWFCPECSFVDAARHGKLRGGSKAALDWFTKSEVEAVARMTRAEDGTYEDHETPAGDEDESLYLSAYGFVFKRQRFSITRKCHAPLFTHEVERELGSWEESLLSCWPACCLPVKAATSSKLAILFKTRLQDKTLAIPYSYRNLYRNAPAYLSSGKIEESEESELSATYYALCTELIQYLREDTAHTMQLSKKLESSFDHHNPFMPISKFLLALETKLIKAYLIDEKWRTSEDQGKQCWTEKVFYCRSVTRLARLAVELVDAAHYRTFLDTWYACIQQGSPDEKKKQEKAAKPRELYFADVVPDVALLADSEMWNDCPIGSISVLLKRKGASFREWISSNRPDLSVSQTRKGRKKGTSMQESESTIIESSLPEKTPTPKKSRELDSLFGEGVASIAKKPRRGRTAVIADDDMHPLSQKLDEVVAALKQPRIPDIHWPIAGRKLFPTTGLLPKKEMRRLARTAGVLGCPHLTYMDSFEVGQMAFCHQWRHEMLQCDSYEELMLLLHVLSTNVDAEAIKRFSLAASKAANGKLKSPDYAMASIRHLSDGLEHVLVFNTRMQTASWLSSRKVDPNILVPVRMKQNRKSTIAENKRFASCQSTRSSAVPLVDYSLGQPLQRPATTGAPVNRASASSLRQILENDPDALRLYALKNSTLPSVQTFISAVQTGVTNYSAQTAAQTSSWATANSQQPSMSSVHTQYAPAPVYSPPRAFQTTPAPAPVYQAPAPSYSHAQVPSPAASYSHAHVPVLAPSYSHAQASVPAPSYSHVQVPAPAPSYTHVQVPAPGPVHVQAPAYTSYGVTQAPAPQQASYTAPAYGTYPTATYAAPAPSHTVYQAPVSSPYLSQTGQYEPANQTTNSYHPQHQQQIVYQQQTPIPYQQPTQQYKSTRQPVQQYQQQYQQQPPPPPQLYHQQQSQQSQPPQYQQQQQQQQSQPQQYPPQPSTTYTSYLYQYSNGNQGGRY